jgi:hypothetical protein
VRVLKAAALYFGWVFGVGFVLGTIRTFWIVPHAGARTAELLETPVMLAVSLIVARAVVKRLSVPPQPASRLGMGILALVMMVAAESGLLLAIRGLTIRQYIATRDPVAAAAYYTSLVLFALFPLVLIRAKDRNHSRHVS